MMYGKRLTPGLGVGGEEVVGPEDELGDDDGSDEAVGREEPVGETVASVVLAVVLVALPGGTGLNVGCPSVVGFRVGNGLTGLKVGCLAGLI